MSVVCLVSSLALLMLGRWNELDSAVSRPVLRVTSGVPEVALGSVMAVVIGPWKGRGGGGE